MCSTIIKFKTDLYIVLHSPPPPPMGGGEIIKRFGDGEKIQEGKKRKKENLGKIKDFAVPNHKNRLVKHNLTLFKP